MKQYYNMLRVEMQMCMKEAIQYKVSLVSDFVVFTLTYIAIYYFGVNVGFSTYYATDKGTGNLLVLMGYIFWQLNSVALGYSSSSVKDDARKGILELRIQSKYSTALLLFMQLIVSVLMNMLTFIGILILTIIFTGQSWGSIYALLLALLITIPSIIGMYGIGLIIGGVSLTEKNVGQFVFIIQAALLFVSNVLAPGRIFLINILPFPLGIEIARKIYLNMTIAPSEVCLYLVVNAIWLVAGVMFFHWMLNKQKKIGTFDSY